MLRYIILVFAIYHILPVASVLKEAVNMSVYVYLVAAVPVAFMGGRLSKFKKNAVIMAIVLALYIFNVIYLAKDPVGAGLIGRLSQWYIINEPVIWAVLCCSYAIRYNDHKNAGLEEKNQVA